MPVWARSRLLALCLATLFVLAVFGGGVLLHSWQVGPGVYRTPRHQTHLERLSV
jgi:hypothetical protein